MSKTEIFLLIILAVILLGSIWFIFSDEIWLLLCYLESKIYPTFSVPE
ncbi:Ecr family regulatory small membrane protein [Klebsiella pneumoniae]